MHKQARRVVGIVAAVLALTVPAMAEFLSPDWSKLSIEGLDEPDWILGVQDGAYIGMCVTCDGTLMLQVQVLPDDGTGSRVRSGETTAESYTAMGEANAANSVARPPTMALSWSISRPPWASRHELGPQWATIPRPTNCGAMASSWSSRFMGRISPRWLVWQERSLRRQRRRPSDEVALYCDNPCQLFPPLR